MAVRDGKEGTPFWAAAAVGVFVDGIGNSVIVGSLRSFIISRKFP